MAKSRSPQAFKTLEFPHYLEDAPHCSYYQTGRTFYTKGDVVTRDTNIEHPIANNIEYSTSGDHIIQDQSS